MTNADIFLRQYRTTATIRITGRPFCKNPLGRPCFCSQERTDSSCQAGSVSQNQIRSREHDIEFGSLLFEPSVSCFSETQLFLDDTECVLHFGADRGLCVFCFLCSILTAFAQLFHLGWTAVDSVFDLATSLVADDRIAALFCSEVTAVAIYFIFISGQQLGCFCGIMDIRCCCLHGMNQSAVPVNSDMCQSARYCLSSPDVHPGPASFPYSW